MDIRLHANATTTPKIRRYIQNSDLSDRKLAAELGITVDTVRRWRKRCDVKDRSHTPHRLRTTLSSAQERLVVELRRTLLLPLDDLLNFTREFIHPQASRSGLSSCLRRHGVSKLADLAHPDEKRAISGKSRRLAEPGLVRLMMTPLPKLEPNGRPSHLCVALDLASRWLYPELRRENASRSAHHFLNRLVSKAPFRVHTLITANEEAFNTGASPFGQALSTHQIEHRPLPSSMPKPLVDAGPLEMISHETLLHGQHIDPKNVKGALKQFTQLYNHRIPQNGLDQKTPMEVLKRWRRQRPDLFLKAPHRTMAPSASPEPMRGVTHGLTRPRPESLHAPKPRKTNTTHRTTRSQALRHHPMAAAHI